MQKKNELKLPLKCKKMKENEMEKINGGSKKKEDILKDFLYKILKP